MAATLGHILHHSTTVTIIAILVPCTHTLPADLTKSKFESGLRTTNNPSNKGATRRRQRNGIISSSGSSAALAVRTNDFYRCGGGGAQDTSIDCRGSVFMGRTGEHATIRTTYVTDTYTKSTKRIRVFGARKFKSSCGLDEILFPCGARQRSSLPLPRSAVVCCCCCCP